SYLQKNSTEADLIVKTAGFASSASDDKQEIILDSISYSDYPLIAKILEARLSTEEVKRSIAQETLLHLATIEQRLGNLDKAKNILETLNRKDSSLNPSIILLRGKIESQSGSSPQRIRQIISELDKPELETTEAERNKVKSSLLWRLATIEAAQGNKEWKRSLQQQLELSTAPYLLAHNQQCFSMIGVNASSNSGNNPEKHRNGLLDAFTGYMDIPGFSFLEQCVASNFIFQGYAHSLQGHILRKYKAILAARVLFERSKVHKQTEAIVEVLGLLGEDEEEIISLLFEDINKLAGRHKHGDLIADCYYEVYMRIASGRSVDVIAELMEEIT
ncbi:MAG: hypothetical protein N0E48_02015, partial [Candidatus Thiodiazotropha endolucinida]|nr:hypothetical protein [Candidatus Thiodiazotropha taylori]MCW4342136.1 hypothetical protein [Candidatus Thiodiazotropha endolucinida]